jgi:hypothetical protein
LKRIAPLARLDDRGDWNLHPGSLTLFRCGGGGGGGGGGRAGAAVTAAADAAACGGSDEVRCLELSKHVVKVIDRLSNCRFGLLLTLLHMFRHSDKHGIELNPPTIVVIADASQELHSDKISRVG